MTRLVARPWRRDQWPALTAKVVVIRPRKVVRRDGKVSDLRKKLTDFCQKPEPIPTRQRTADRGWREASGRVGDWCLTQRAQLVRLGPTVWRVGPTVWRMHTGVWRPPHGRGADFRYCY